MIPNKTICLKIWLEYYVLKLFLCVWFHEPTTSESPTVFVTKVCPLQIAESKFLGWTFFDKLFRWYFYVHQSLRIISA